MMNGLLEWVDRIKHNLYLIVQLNYKPSIISMPIVIGGNHPDKTSLQILQMIRDIIISNWLETDPPIEDIRFNFDWNDDYGEYTVSILHNLSAQRLAILGNKIYDINMSVMIHIFVKQLTEEHPMRAGNMEKEIMRILVSNTGNLGNGIEYASPKSFTHADEEDSTSVYWHSIANLMLTFTKKII